MPMENLTEIVRRIPIFKGLDDHQFESMLAACHECTFDEGTVVFTEGDPSTDMYIIMSGSFQVRSLTGAEIAVIGDTGIVGEMGVLTERPRSATVVAYRPTRALRIGHDALHQLIEKDSDMGLVVYRNITHILSDRLRDNNIVLEQQYLILEDLTGDNT